MYSYIESNHTDVRDTNLVFILRVWNEVCETHQDVDEHKVRALVYSLRD